MKRILGLALLLLAATSYSQVQKKILFIGNSYTNANNLPELITSLAQASGNSIISDAYTPGGSQLNQHATNPVVLNKIAAEDWDFVVLQEQSQLPAFPYAQTSTLFYPNAAILADSIYANNECSLPLFYNTWGRQVGDPQWDSINTFQKMNKRLFEAYSLAAEQAGAMLSPIGIGFSHVNQDGNAIVNFNDLYTNDGSHPTIKGSYLAACIFNNVIFSGISTGNTFVPNGINAAEAGYLQGVADHVVYDVDSIQLDFRPELSNNDFTVVINSGQGTFNPLISEGDFDSWNFGDGQTSTLENATHTYTSNGTFEVVMYSSAKCQTDSVKQDVTISTLGVFLEELSAINVYPNPSSNGMINIDLNGLETYTVFTLLGKEIYQGSDKQLTLSKGVYVVKYNSQSRKIIVL
ncbi:DUF4886 domain-containing protein [Brumimicrobium mesophilum]|uniref:DUF4886 domain-containing protein n=1 Tax=Brumimicrobium mesophilum TaxID=392717 RepID=UPI00131D8DC6|nr:DUF4886 domain-containing protein [Brumimicrobium mesophilum]